MCHKLKERLEINLDLSKSWCYGYTLEMDAFNVNGFNVTMPYKSASSDVQCEDNTDVSFIDAKGIRHTHYAPSDQTVNQTLDLVVVKSLWDEVRWKRPDQWQSEEWWFHSSPQGTCTYHLQFETDFNPKIARPFLPTLPIHPVLLPAMFFVLLNEKTLKNVLQIWKRWRKKQFWC